MDNTILQIPISKTLKKQATEAAKDLGFSSLQETVRIFLKKLAKGVIDISFTEPTILSAQAARRYDKTIDDIDSGKAPVYSANSVDELLDHLHGKTNSVLTRIHKKL